jgi:hypothetical protein
MKEVMDFFNNELKPLATNFRSNNTFWFAFVNIKHIGKPHSHHGCLLALCQNELGTPIYGLKVTVDTFTDPDTGKTYKSASATTDVNGDAEVSQFFAGYRTVTISGPNIETTTFPAISFERAKAICRSFTVRAVIHQHSRTAGNQAKSSEIRRRRRVQTSRFKLAATATLKFELSNLN